MKSREQTRLCLGGDKQSRGIILCFLNPPLLKTKWKVSLNYTCYNGLHIVKTEWQQTTHNDEGQSHFFLFSFLRSVIIKWNSHCPLKWTSLLCPNCQKPADDENVSKMAIPCLCLFQHKPLRLIYAFIFFFSGLQFAFYCVVLISPEVTFWKEQNRWKSRIVLAKFIMKNASDTCVICLIIFS